MNNPGAEPRGIEDKNSVFRSQSAIDHHIVFCILLAYFPALLYTS